jgi:hypothetical protein
VTNVSGQTIARTPATSAVSGSLPTARASGTSAAINRPPASMAMSESAAVSTGTAVQGAGTSQDTPLAALATPATAFAAAMSTGYPGGCG